MILKTFELKSERDICALDIIDFSRLNGYWPNLYDAIRTIHSWVGNGKFFVSHVQIPKFHGYYRNDFPGWEHTGRHIEKGKRYWNWFMSTRHDRRDTLQFSDSPDFYGTIGANSFWGDIGQVSPMAFMQSIKWMKEGDLWISIPSEGEYQIVLEARYSPRLCRFA